LPKTPDYNLAMLSVQRLIIRVVFVCLIVIVCSHANAQSRPKPSGTGSTREIERAIAMAESGQCSQALPLLKKTFRAAAGDIKKRAGLDGLHCAMTQNMPYESLAFLEGLVRDFPRDPDVLYSTTHAFSDLSLATSRQLMHEAPFSYQVHELNAEALELQGRWDEAAADYRKILEINPLLPGIHARLGRALLSKPQPSPAAVQEAKKQFEEELQIDPKNAGAEYVLGELAKDANELSSAIDHYSRAVKLDKNFSEAYLGLGGALVAAGRYSEAVTPLETYVKLAPDSPTGHYQLARAYSGLGRKADANREAALQRETAESLEQIKRKIAEQQQRGSQPQIDSPPKN
jgi:tetratricopeptide (TPR) repeat protein